MKRIAICTLFVSLALPAAASASFRPQPSRLPPAPANAPADFGRGGWDTRPQDAWDRQLRRCLNDHHQTRRERRVCADMGMPVKASDPLAQR